MHLKNIKLKENRAEKSSKQLVYKYEANIGVEIVNYQWKVLLLNIFQIQLIQVAMRQNQNFINT